MRKLGPLFVTFVAVGAIAVCGCSQNQEVEGSGSSIPIETDVESSNDSPYSDDLNDMQELSLYWLTVNLPSSWEVDRSTENRVQIVPSVGGLAQLSMNGNIDFVNDGSEEVDTLLQTLDGDVTHVLSDKRKGACGDAVTYTVDISREQDGVPYCGFAEFIVSGHSIYSFMVVVPEEDYEKGYDEVLKAISDSFSLKQSAEPYGAGEGYAGTDGSQASSDTGNSMPTENAQPQESASAATITEGKYRVGSDVAAGEYKLTATPGETAYWEVTDSSNPDADIVGNEVFENSTYVTVSDGQYITLRGCTGVIQGS